LRVILKILTCGLKNGEDLVVKRLMNFLIFILIILTYSCVQKGKMKSNKTIDNVKTRIKENSSFDKNLDSIRQAKVMTKAFAIVKENLSKELMGSVTITHHFKIYYDM